MSQVDVNHNMIAKKSEIIVFINIKMKYIIIMYQ